MSTTQTRLAFPVKKRNSIIPTSKLNKNDFYYTQDSITISSSENENTPEKRTPRKTKSISTTSHVTPPKQHRLSSTLDDTENVGSPKTPSTLLAKLDISSFNCELENSENDKHSRKRLFDSSNDRYDNARRALHSAAPTNMPARTEELENLRNFISENLGNLSSGTLYISGPPGTGKTAALTKTLAELEVGQKYKDVYINCTSIKSAQAVYAKISKELGLKSSGRTEKAYLASIETFLQTKHQPIILVLDEIDQLDSRKQSVLYTIFEWPSKLNSRLVLIGIANALDLTDRILPRLQARCELKPKLMHFAPYSKSQIVEIIAERLNSAGVSEVFSGVAIQMLAGKVAAVSGDVRRALDIARRVIETISNEPQIGQKQEDALKLELNPIQEPIKSVGVSQVVSVLSNVYGTSQNLQDDVDDSIPLQQKIVLCSLVLMLKKGKNKDVTIGKLCDVYRKVCRKRNFSTIDQSEFVGLCELLETRGIVRVHGRKEPRLNKISLEWDEDEVALVLKDKQLMSSILLDESVLSR